MKRLLTLGVLLAVFSAAKAAEKVPVPQTLTGRISALGQVDPEGNLQVDGRTFRLFATTKAGDTTVHPLDLQERNDLAFLLVKMRHREMTLSGVVVEKEWTAILPLPFGGRKLGVVLTQPVFRVNEVQINFDKEPLVKPGDDE